METPILSAELSQKYSQRKNLMLVLSIVFDVVGIITYIIPGLGEGFDVAWAPIAGFIMYIMYGGFIGVFGGMFVFLEELLPFTDILPGFTIMWFIKYVLLAKKTQKQFVESKGQHILPSMEDMKKKLPVNG